MSYTICTPLTLAAAAALAEPAGSLFSVRDFGACADGRTNDAPAVQKAIGATARVRRAGLLGA